MSEKRKRGMALLLAVALLCGTNQEICVRAAQSETSLNWDVSAVSLEHKKISFTLGDVDSVQEASVVVADSDSDEIVAKEKFSINSSSQNISVDLTDGYLKAGSYYVYVENGSGEKTEKRTASVSNHSSWFWVSGNAYPNCFVGELTSLSNLKSITPKITASVGFQDYEGTIDEEGNITLEYPAQETDTIIEFKIYDEYGCEYTFKKTVEDVKFSKKSLKAWYTGISLSWYDELKETVRICAEVDGQTYYSEYGASVGRDDTMILSYPSASAGSVTVWYESKYGSISEKETLEIKPCELKDCSYTVSAHQFNATGTVAANSKNQRPVKVKLTVAGTEYCADIAEDGTFTLSYPSQENYQEISLIFEDTHGCSYELKKDVLNSIESSCPVFDEAAILPTNATMDTAKEGVRLAAQIGENVYYGEYGGKTVVYPFQAPGTTITFWLEAENSNLSKQTIKQVFSGDYAVKISARTGSAVGDIYNEEYDYSADISSAYVEIAGKQYNCKIEKKTDKDDDWSENETYYHFSVNYPIQKIGTTITFYFTDTNQITVSKAVTLTNIAPKIKLDKIDSSTKKVSGTTTAKSTVTITAGKKKYKCKANAKGSFSVKIKEQKKGTKVTVSVVTPEGYTNQSSTKVKQASGTVSITNYVYKSSNRIKLNLYNAKKGDKLRVAVGSKTYTKKITSNKRSQNVTVNIKKASAGTSVRATLSDKFSKKKDSATTKVFYGDTIYKGMSATNAQLTTWGYPVRKNDYGWGSVQWVYESGSTTLYAYVKGGKVVNVQRINY